MNQYKDEDDCWFVEDLKFLPYELKRELIQSHISMIEEEIKELGGMKKPKDGMDVMAFKGTCLARTYTSGYNQAIQDIISHKEKELSEYKELIRLK